MISGKGGEGKSSLAYLLARALTQAGRSVAVQDLDPQGTLRHLLEGADWLAEDVADVTVVDTPPRIDAPVVLAAIEGADRIVVPVSPSPVGIAALRATLDVVNGKRSTGTPVLVVINRTRAGTALTASARTALESLGTTVAATEIPERQSIQKAFLGDWRTLEVATRETVLALALEVLTATD